MRIINVCLSDAYNVSTVARISAGVVLSAEI